GVTPVLGRDPHLAEEVLEGRGEVLVGSRRPNVRVRLAVVLSMVEVDPEHSVVGVAPRAAEVGTYGTRYGTDRTRRQVPVKEVLGNPQPPMGHRAGHLQPLAAQVFEQHAPEDV